MSDLTDPRDLDAAGVVAALGTNGSRPYGKGRTLVAEELVAAAERFGDRPLLIQALLDLMDAYTFGAEQKASPIAFARVLRLWDSRPEDFDRQAKHRVFWQFKWVAEALLDVPDVPLATIRHWSDEMARRYAAAGYRTHAVHQMRYAIAAHAGVGADEAFARWTGTPRDDMSNCRACEAHVQGNHHRDRGEDERALTLWGPVLDGRVVCAEEPHHVKASALLSLVRLGRLDEARTHHLTGYRMSRGNDNLMAAIGKHLEFCALTGNEARGVELLAHSRALFAALDNPRDHLEFLTGVRVLLARLAAGGHGGLAVAGPAGRDWRVDTLLAETTARSDALARGFDERNGTTAASDRVAARLARPPLLDEPLPLGVRVAAVVPAPRRSPDAADAGPEGRPHAAAETGLDVLVARAREAHDLARPDATALWRQVGERAARDSTFEIDDLLRGEIAEASAADAASAERFAAASAAYEAAARALDAAGRRDRAATARVRGAYTTLAGNATPEAGAALDAAVAAAEALHAEGGTSADEILRVRRVGVLALARAAHADGRAMRGALDALVADAREAGVPHQTAAALAMRADLLAAGGDLAAAEADTLDALAVVERADRPWLAAGPLTLLGRIELATGRPAPAREHFHRALALSREWHDEHYPRADTLVLLARAAGDLGDVAEVVGRLAEAADRFERAGNATAALANRVDLAAALRDAGRPGEAVSVVESALDAGDQPGDQADQADAGSPHASEQLVMAARLELARSLRALGEVRAAAEEMVRLAGVAAGRPDRDAYTRVACEAAVALAEAAMWPEATTAYQRALDAHAAAPRPSNVLAMMRDFAAAEAEPAWWDEDEDDDEGTDTATDRATAAALARLAAADALIATTPDEPGRFSRAFESGLVHQARADVHLGRDDSEAALAEVARASDLLGGVPGAERARAEADRIAAAIEGRVLDRPGPARARLDAAIARTAAAGHADAAEILAHLRESLPEPDSTTGTPA